MFKASVSSYSFSQLINSGKLTQLECVAKAKEMGFDALEIAELSPHDGSSNKEYAEKIAAESRRLDLPISSFTVGADFLNGSDGDLKAEIEKTKEKVDHAAILGAKLMRHDGTSGYQKGVRQFRGFDDALPIIADGCRQVTEYAATKGIRTMVENHGYFCQDSDRVEKLVNTVAHENFGLLVDIGNFMCADEDSIKAVGRVAPYAFYVHAKDFIVKSGNGINPGKCFFTSRNGTYLRGTILGHGEVPVLQCLRALKQAGYEGYVSVEFEGQEEAAFAVGICLENLRRFIAAV